MMTNKLIATLVPLALLSISCTAKYRTIHRSQASEDAPTGGSTAGDDVAKAPELPAAGVEVLKDGTATTVVIAGEPFLIRPTEQTRDPDNKPVAGCRNVGIISALYKVSDGAILSTTRTEKGCEDLSTTHVVLVPGTVTIHLQVQSDEGEPADATMTLIVVAKDTPPADLPDGFVVTADPLIVHTGIDVTFVGECVNGKVTWDFEAGKRGEGATIKHPFQSPGQYPVKAKCERPGQEPQDGMVTISVVPQPVIPTATGTGTGGSSETGSTGGTGGTTGGSSETGTTGGTGSGTTGGSSETGSTGGTGGTTGGSSETGTTGGTTGGTGTTTGGTGTTTGGTTGTDGDDDPNHPGQTPGQYPGQTPGQTPGQSPHQSPKKS